MNVHSTSSRMSSEHSFESEQNFLRCCAFDNISQNILRQRGDQSTEDHLILNEPSLKIGVGLKL
jgi:hypothetical protein